MQIANDPANRVILEEGKTRRRQLMQLFYKCIGQDVTILNTCEYERLIRENETLEAQLKMLNQIRQAELDKKDIHRPV